MYAIRSYYVLGLFEDIHEMGTTVLFATHDRTLLDVRPRRVVVLDDGKATDVPQGLGALQSLFEDDEDEDDVDVDAEAEDSGVRGPEAPRRDVG